MYKPAGWAPTFWRVMRYVAAFVRPMGWLLNRLRPCLHLPNLVLRRLGHFSPALTAADYPIAGSPAEARSDSWAQMEG